MNKRVAIVYDWADTHWGGAEKVLAVLAELFPEATLYTSFVTPSVAWTKKFARVETTWLGRWPRFLHRHKWLLTPFLWAAFASLDVRAYDLIISVTSCAAKNVRTSRQQLHVCYLLTPTRFLWIAPEQYLPVMRFGLWPVIKFLQYIDKKAAARPDKIIAISQLVAERCQKYYGRRVDRVIYPTILDDEPIDHILCTNIDKNCTNCQKNIDVQYDENFKNGSKPFFLFVGRLRAYKKCQACIEACGQLGVPLVIVGAGGQEKFLRQLVDKKSYANVTFVKNISPKCLKMYYNTAYALLAPGEEDFGINLLEANAAGLLVVTHPRSGAAELLDNRQKRTIEERQTQESLKKQVDKIAAAGRQKVPAGEWSRQKFADEFASCINEYVKKHFKQS